MIAGGIKVIVFLLMLGRLTITNCATVSPGCSFTNNQCIYSIQIGHQNQCDSTTPTSPTTPGTDCCNDLTTKYLALRDDVDDLKAQVMSNYASQIQQLRNDLLQARNSLASCQVPGGGVTPIPTPTPTLTPPTTTTTTRHTIRPNTASSASPYNVTYYSFNVAPKGFTLSKMSGQVAAMELLNSSSHSTSGPKNEHSWGTKPGHYLGINNKAIAEHNYGSNREMTANAESGEFLPANAYCILFWYYMEGVDVQTLAANIKIDGGDGYPIFTSSGPKNVNQWKLAEIDLDPEYTSHKFQIDISMTSNAYYSYSSGTRQLYNTRGDIAIDDLYVINRSCKNVRRYPQGAHYYKTGTTSSYYTFHSNALTWREAYDACRRKSPWSALVSIETVVEQQYLVNIIQSDAGLSAIGKNGFYTSGSDADTEKTFVWTNTGVGRPLMTTMWHSGQPNNMAGNQNCLLMEYSSNAYEWGDVDCESKHPFICEVDV